MDQGFKFFFLPESQGQTHIFEEVDMFSELDSISIGLTGDLKRSSGANLITSIRCREMP